MFVIFGRRWKETTLGQISYSCSHCAKTTFHSAIVRKGRFTLFFIPVIPLSTRYIIKCNMCGLKLKPVGTLHQQIVTWHRTGKFPAAVQQGAAPPPLVGGAANASSFCQSCGKPLLPGAQFCTACGHVRLSPV